MSMTKQTYSAPKLTYYGKLSEITQAGSLVTTQQIPLGGFSIPGQFYNADNDGSTAPDSIDVVEITTSSGEKKLIPVQFLESFNFGVVFYRYDSNGNGLSDITLYDFDDDGTIDSVGTAFDTNGTNPWQGYYNS